MTISEIVDGLKVTFSAVSLLIRYDFLQVFVSVNIQISRMLMVINVFLFCFVFVKIDFKIIRCS